MTEAVRKSVFDDLDALRMSTDDVAGAGGVRIVTHVPLRKPMRHEIFRVNPDPAYLLTTSIYIDRAEMRNDVYLVPPLTRAALVGETRAVLLVPFMTLQEVLGIWPITLPTDDGRHNAWHETARDAFERAKTRWVRMAADPSLGGYRVYDAVGNIDDPVWPGIPFKEILDIAFRGRIIDSENHPVIRRLRGAV